jgi:hypothetical protein
MSFGDECGCDLLCDYLNGVTRRLEAGEVREDPAVLGDLVEADAVKYWNQRLLV